ncbi:MAG: hypothetical protein ACFFD8_11120 [Candidatus Thorarchaeota archaeon]
MNDNGSQKSPEDSVEKFSEKESDRLERLEKTFTVFITVLVISQSIYLAMSQSIYGPSVDLRLLLRPTFTPLVLGIALWVIGQMSPRDNIRTNLMALAWTPVLHTAIYYTIGGFLAVVFLDLAFLIVPADIGVIFAFLLAPYQSEVLITLYNGKAKADKTPLHQQSKQLIQLCSRILMIFFTLTVWAPYFRFWIWGVLWFGPEFGPWIGLSCLMIMGLMVSFLPKGYSLLRTRISKNH